MVGETENSAINELEAPKASWGEEVNDIRNDKIIPVLGASSKDTARMHKEKPSSPPKDLGASSKDTARMHKEKPSSPPKERKTRTPRMSQTRSRDDSAPKPKSGRPGLRRCNTTDGVELKRGAARRGRKPNISPRPSSGHGSSAAGDLEIRRSESPKKRGGSPRSPREKLERRHRRGRGDDGSPSRAGLPPKQSSRGGRKGSPSGRSSPVPRVARRNRATGEATERPTFRRGAIEARRQKSARNLGLRRTKSLDEGSAQFDMGWRRARRRDMNASGGTLNADSAKFLDNDMHSDNDDVSIDLESKAEEEDKDGNDKTSGDGGGGRGTGRANNNRNRNKQKRHGFDVSRSQLSYGIELQDQRMREEEEEEARRRRHQTLKKQASKGSRSRSNSPTRSNRDCPNSKTPFNITLAAPKIAVPKFEVATPKFVADTYQSATAASQSAYQAATAASVSANLAATQAANVMSGAAAKAAAALAFPSTTNATNANDNNNAPIMSTRPKKSTVSERELAARFNFNSKAGSSAFNASSSGFGAGSNSAPFQSISSTLRDTSGSNGSPKTKGKSEEFAPGNGLELF